jgi:ApbE superfamily uncharacterized protein (UPF0280 family)
VSGPARARLPDGRLHLQHGPIDVIARAWGEKAEVERSYEQAWERFRSVLDELVSELPQLRKPVNESKAALRGAVARRMLDAVWPHRSVYVTPMAAVAGAVADELLAAMTAGRRIAKAFVNDGGDIAVHLAPGEALQAGIVGQVLDPAIEATATLRFEAPARGIATSGWRGRSQSLGIADAVTILARNAAQADAAATLVANAVDARHPAIERRPARELKEDSDLGDLSVTVAVGQLPPEVIEEAIARGAAEARRMQAAGLLVAAYLSLQGRTEALSPALEALSAHSS